MFKSIKSKFIVSAMLIILVTIGGPAFFLIYQFDKNFEDRSVIMLATTVDVVLSSIKHSMQHDEKNIQNVVEMHALNQNVDNIRVFSENGLINYSSDTTELGQNIELVAAHHVDKNATREIFLIEPENIYSTLVPLRNDKTCQKCHEQKDTIAYLDIDTKLTHSEIRFYTGVRHSIFLAVLVIIILVLTLYYIFNYFIGTPLKSVMGDLAEVEKGNFKIRRPRKNEDEFGALDQHFNNMVNRLEKSQQEIETFHFEQLQRADKLVTLGELAAEMAHEINNPAGVIMARADYLQLESEDKAAIQPYSEDIDVILHQTQKIARITNNILKYSKKLPRDFQQLDVTQIINESIKILDHRLHKKNITLNKIYRCDDECKEALIFGDPQQMEQVFTNLFNNAIDALKNGGNLEIRVSCRNNEKVQVVLKDNGEGMDEVSKEKIFLPFFSTKTAKNGTGLGLYIVKNIIKNHGAEISCESELNKGTTFTLTFNKVIN